MHKIMLFFGLLISEFTNAMPCQWISIKPDTTPQKIKGMSIFWMAMKPYIFERLGLTECHWHSLRAFLLAIYRDEFRPGVLCNLTVVPLLSAGVSEC